MLLFYAYYRITRFQLGVHAAFLKRSITEGFKRRKTLLPVEAPGDLLRFWRELYFGFCPGLDLNIICVMGCEITPSTKNIRNKP